MRVVFSKSDVKDKKMKVKVRGSFQEPMSASALAKHILWNKPSIQNSIKDYKNKFKLK
tara:strand:- start:2024 stop:2197 length:174 start_codon:yes stop_codon:yes gene_type:complete